MFLLKPHVTGPEDQITSPDVIVDTLYVNGDMRPLAQLTHECWQQAEPGTQARAAYAIMALGGGALILPALALSSGPLIVSRQSWRLNSLDGHIEQLRLNDIPLSDVGLPMQMITAAGGTGDALPRGFLLVCATEIVASTATLADPILGRELQHDCHLEDMSADRWGDKRPRPRYSVGPTQKDVPHYI